MVNFFFFFDFSNSNDISILKKALKQLQENVSIQVLNSRAEDLENSESIIHQLILLKFSCCFK